MIFSHILILPKFYLNRQKNTAIRDQFEQKTSIHHPQQTSITRIRCEDVFCEVCVVYPNFPWSICIFLGRGTTESKVPPAAIRRAIYFIAIHIILMWRRDGSRHTNVYIYVYTLVLCV